MEEIYTWGMKLFVSTFLDSYKLKFIILKKIYFSRCIALKKNILFTIKSIEKNILFDKIDEKEVLFLENKWRVGEINV